SVHTISNPVPRVFVISTPVPEPPLAYRLPPASVNLVSTSLAPPFVAGHQMQQHATSQVNIGGRGARQPAVRPGRALASRPPGPAGLDYRPVEVPVPRRPPTGGEVELPAPVVRSSSRYAAVCWSCSLLRSKVRRSWSVLMSLRGIATYLP